MRYFVKMYGPFGPRQSGQYIDIEFETEKERGDYLERMKGGLSVACEKWEK